MKRIVAVLIMLAATFLAGCQSMNSSGAPKPPFDLDKDIEALSARFNGTNTITSYYDLTEDDERLHMRNRFISGRLALIDLNYLQYVRALTADKQMANIGAELANMSLGLAGTLVGGVRAKTNLAAAATGLAGTKTTIDKEIYYEKSMDAIIKSMNAARKELAVGILTGLNTANISDYPFEIAIVRLDEYYMAGTIKGALSFITTQAVEKEKASDIKIGEIEVPVLTDTTPELNAIILRLSKNIYKEGVTPQQVSETLESLGENKANLNLEMPKLQKMLRMKVRQINRLPSLEEKNKAIVTYREAFTKSGLWK